MARVFKASAALAAAMVLVVMLTPSTNPSPLVEAAFGLGLIGVAVSGVVLAYRRWLTPR